MLISIGIFVIAIYTLVCLIFLRLGDIKDILESIRDDLRKEKEE